MSLTTIVVTRPIGTLMSCLCVAILGALAMVQMPIHLRPKAEYPVLTITTRLADSNAEEVELLITKPLEDGVSDVPGIRKLDSVSRSGESQITLQFHVGRDLNEATLEVRSRLRRVAASFPRDTRSPVMTRYNPSDTPMAVLAITGGHSPEETGEWADRFLRTQLSRIDGVGTVVVSSPALPEIVVECDAQRLRALDLTVREVAHAIETGHKSLPAGLIHADGKRTAVRTTGHLATTEDISGQPVRATELGGVITVGELCRVRRDVVESEGSARLNGKPLVTMSIFKATDADLAGTWKAVNTKIQEIQAQAADGHPVIQVVFNESEELEKTLSRLGTIVPVTALLTGTVLFLFLGTLSSTLIVMTAIPFSLSLSLLFMYLLGIRLDLLSLSGLTLGLGILVDNSIVVIESISRRLDQGLPSREAVVAGADEVALPLFLSTLTTVGVFLPVIFLSREIRLFFVGFSWAVSLSLAASLMASLVLIPALFLYLGTQARQGKGLARMLSDLSGPYSRLLSVVQRRRRTVLLGAALFLGVCAYIALGLSFRQAETGKIFAYKVVVVSQPGTAREFSEDIAAIIERGLLSLPYVTRTYTEIKGSQVNLTISLDPEKCGDDPGDELNRRVKSLVGDRPVQVHVMGAGGHGKGRQISLDIQGNDVAGLVSLQRSILGSLMSVQGVQDVVVRQGNPVPVVGFIVRHGEVGYRGVHAQNLSHHIRSHLTGPLAARVPEGDRLVDVRVRAVREAGEGLEAIEDVRVRSDWGGLLPLSELATPMGRLEPTDLHRLNRRPVLGMTVVLPKDEDPLSVAQRMSEALDRLGLPPGFNYVMGEEIRDILRMRKEMMTAVAVGLVLIYLVLTMATESFVLPFVIMTAVPFAGGGVVLASWLLGFSISLPVYVGMVILCGLVINVNIVMVHAIDDRRLAGACLEEAVESGALRRLRPILMTVMTTVGGALPLIFDTGRGSEIWRPLALALSAGVAVSAVFSLVLTPTLSQLLGELVDRVGSKRTTLPVGVRDDA